VLLIQFRTVEQRRQSTLHRPKQPTAGYRSVSEPRRLSSNLVVPELAEINQNVLGKSVRVRNGGQVLVGTLGHRNGQYAGGQRLARLPYVVLPG
jgi:hypothetical protein